MAAWLWVLQGRAGRTPRSSSASFACLHSGGGGRFTSRRGCGCCRGRQDASLPGGGGRSTSRRGRRHALQLSALHSPAPLPGRARRCGWCFVGAGMRLGCGCPPLPPARSLDHMPPPHTQGVSSTSIRHSSGPHRQWGISSRQLGSLEAHNVVQAPLHIPPAPLNHLLPTGPGIQPLAHRLLLLRLLHLHRARGCMLSAGRTMACGCWPTWRAERPAWRARRGVPPPAPPPPPPPTCVLAGSPPSQAQATGMPSGCMMAES